MAPRSPASPLESPHRCGSSDDQLQLDAGCNNGSGAVAVTADTLEFGPLILTKRACQADPSSVEEAVTKVLTGSVDYTIEADLLTIDAGGPGPGLPRRSLDPRLARQASAETLARQTRGEILNVSRGSDAIEVSAG